MKHTIFEFKARLSGDKYIRAVLKKLHARFVGIDHQVDTYFRVPFGRLKLRAARIENALIFYRRTDAPQPRKSRVAIIALSKRNPLRSLLASPLSVLAVVKKRREIYFVGNVKVHLDRVQGLGKFVEVEAMSRPGDLPKALSEAQKFLRLLAIPPSDLMPESYSDLILKKFRH